MERRNDSIELNSSSERAGCHKNLQEGNINMQKKVNTTIQQDGNLKMDFNPDTEKILSNEGKAKLNTSTLNTKNKRRKKFSQHKSSSGDPILQLAREKRHNYEQNYKKKLSRALKKREKTLEEMFRMETQHTMELFGADANGSSDFNAFHEIVKNIFLPEELPPMYRNDIDRLILELDEDKSGTLEVDEVNVWFKSIFHGKIQSKGFKRVREIKTMKNIFEISQDTARAQNYLLISNADTQLDTFFRSFVLSAELYVNPIAELSDIAPREVDPRKIDEIIHDLIEGAMHLEKEGRIYFDDFCQWYLKQQGGWSLMEANEELR